MTNLEQQIIINNFPCDITTNIYGSNRYAGRVIQLLQDYGYKSIFPIETTRVLIAKGQDVTFTKELNRNI